MKKIGLLFVSLLWGVFSAQAQGLAEAEKAFNEGNFVQAEKEYRQLLDGASEQDRLTALLRITACQFYNGEYLNAAKTIYGEPLPADPVWKARFLFYRIQTANRVKNTYSPILEESELVAENQPEDLSLLTLEQWNARITQDFESLWALREKLINASVEKETLVLNIQDTDVRRLPTLFDVAVNEWKKWLLQNRPSMQLRAEEVVGKGVQPSESAQNKMEKLSAILLEAARLDGKNRQDAKVFWQTEQLMLPFSYAGYFTAESVNNMYAFVVEQLEVLSGYKTQKPGFFARLKGYVLSPAKTDYAKAYAAFTGARLQNDKEDFQSAVLWCDWAVKNLKASYFTQSCEELAQEIRRPRLSLSPVQPNQNPAALHVNARVRNVPQVYARVYKTSFNELKTLYFKDEGKYYQPTVNSWRFLSSLKSQELETFVKRAPLKTFSSAVMYDKPHIYKEISLSLPELEKGFYVVAVSDREDFSGESAPVCGAIVNVTDLALFVSAAIEGNPEDYRVTVQSKTRTVRPDVFRVYAVDLKTGEAVPNTQLTLFTKRNGTQEKGRTNQDGMFSLKAPVSVGINGRSSSNFINPLGQKDGSYAVSNGEVYFSFYPNDPVALFLETDRAIYRAGQTVKFSANVFAAAPRGMKVFSGAKVTLVARDANYDIFYKQIFTANDMGTLQGEVTIPQGRLLGRYSLQAEVTLSGRKFHQQTGFLVDDYKRPDYELNLQPAQKPFEYGKTAQVHGTAQYYTGAPLQKATVTYKVQRKSFRLPYWWWMGYGSSAVKTVASGTVQTDDKGAFKIEFTPTVPEDGRPEEYVVSVSVRDQSGRDIDAKHSYKASVKENFFALDFTQGFYDENTPASLATVRLTDVNGADVSGKVRMEIARLENTYSSPDKATSSMEEADTYDMYVPAENAANRGTALDRWFGKNRVVAQVLARDYEFNKKSGAQTVAIPALPEGIYKLTLKNNKADTQHFVFVVAAENSQLALPQTAIAQHATYYPGSDARILMGAGSLTAPKRVEIYQNSFLLKKDLAPARVSVYTLPVSEQLRGGVSVRWFGASDYKLYDQKTDITVPFDNKKLDVTFTGPQTVKPGQRAQWQLSAKDVTGAGVQGQASITVYDQSLDYYAAKNLPFGLERLFPAQGLNVRFGQTNAFNRAVSFQHWPAQEKPVFFAETLPSVNLTMRMYAFSRGRMAVNGAAKMQFAMAKTSMAVAESAVEDMEMAMPMAAAGAVSYDGMKLETADVTASQEGGSSVVRTDFSETAYYNPALPLQGGTATVAFTLPQSLTTWKMLGFVITKNADFGSFSATTVTRKDLMVRLALPRFYREGDRGQLKALVTNLGKKKQSVQVELTLKKDGANAASSFGISKTVKTVTVAPNATAQAVWDVTIPDGVGVLSVTAVARAGKESDGEQKEIPLLPSRERLLATTNVALKDGANTLTLTELQNDSSAQPETAVLQVNPSLILTVLNAMPALRNSPYKDLVTQLNKYVPLAVVNKFYTAYPQLREAVAKLPKRSTSKPAWQEDDALRLTLLEQTPWLQASRGGETENLISLFDPTLVAQEKAAALKDVLSYQNPSGAFTWLPGGRDDAYLTLYALDAFSQAKRFGADVPQQNVSLAVKWMTAEINRRLKETSQAGAASVSYSLYAAYTLSAFLQDKQGKDLRPHVQAWMDWADKHSTFMTPLGKAYAATVYHRLGNNVKANAYITVLLAQMKTNPLTGAYFAPEAQSWVWYNDTMATQTATLKALLEVRPNAPEIDAMVQWILFNRQATEWDSARTTAQAVYCLLDVMQKKGVMSEASSYQITWGGQTTRKTLQPFDWTDDLRFVKEGASLSAADYTAQVVKQGGLTDFASLSVVYTSKDPKASPKGVLNVKRAYFVKFIQDGVSKLRPVEDLSSVKVGDEVEVHLTLNADSAFDYVLLADPRPSGFESKDLLSGWSWNPVAVYQENRDAVTNFYINALPAGEVKLKYTLRPTLPGEYRALPAQVQSMYAPEFGAHTAGNRLTVQ